MLMVTHKCNLDCTYCYESYKDDEMMSFDLAKDIILKEVDFVKKSNEFNELEVDFMGGEPFMNFTLIKQVVEWMVSAKLGIPFVTGCATNGTLLTEDIKNWIVKYNRVFNVGLSYDGDYEMQSLNRRSGEVDVDFFIKLKYGDQLHLTISKETLPRLSAGILYVQRKGGYCTVALAQGIPWQKSDAECFRRELKILAEAYLSDQLLEPIHLFTRPLFGIVNQSCEPRKFCGTGKGMATYDVDGVCYPCHMFSPIVIGKGALRQTDIDMCCSKAVTDPYCAGCVYRDWCPTCYGFNYKFRGDSATRDHRWCDMIHAEAQSCCEFQLKYYNLHRDQIGADDAILLRAAIDVYHLLKKVGDDWRTWNKPERR